VNEIERLMKKNRRKKKKEEEIYIQYRQILNVLVCVYVNLDRDDLTDL